MTSLYEQFLAAGSVKSLVTGHEYPASISEKTAPKKESAPSSQSNQKQLNS